MLAKRIIPCLDIDKGRVVKGIKFESLIDAGDPVAQAKRYDAEGADELTFLDITASSDKRAIVADLVRHVADEVFIPLTVGGGINSVEDVRALLRAGCDKTSINTAAIKRPELVTEAAEVFGSQCVVVAIDARRDTSAKDKLRWNVFTHGGRNKTELDAVEWALRVVELGAGEVLLTSMDRDGTRDGYDIELLKAITSRVNVPVIASGGAGKLEHFFDAFVAGGASAVLAASLFHFGEYKIADVKTYLRGRGVVVR